LMNLEGAPRPVEQIELAHLSIADRWILSRLDAAIRAVTSAIDAYEFNVAALSVYQFVWHEFCDWYIELSKEPLKAGGERQAAARYVLVHCFDKMLRLLHPFMPFISEEIWQALRPYLSDSNLSEHLAVANWPQTASTCGWKDAYLEPGDDTLMSRCIELTQSANSLRSLVGHHPGSSILAEVRPLEDGEAGNFQGWKRYAMTLAKLSEILVKPSSAPRPRGMVFAPLAWGEVGIEAPAGFDFERARAMLEKKLEEVRGHLHRNQSRYTNPAFRAKADDETVSEIAEKIEQLKSQENLLRSQVDLLG
jgi:valyl-tRNA synthetase